MSTDRNVIGAPGGKAGGIYLFCFARPHCLPDPGIAGLDDRQPVSQWAFKDIVAVLGMSSIEDFCGPEAENRMKDLAWIGPRVCRHEEVVEQVMRRSPAFPARFGTIFSSFDALEKLFDVHYDEISRFLDKAAGKEEWAVKGLLDRAQARRSFSSLMLAREERRLASLSPGKRYLSEQRIRSSADRELNRWLKGVIKGIGDDLCRHSSEFCERKALSLDSEEMDRVLNWAFWVAREDADDFRARVERANEQNDREGLLLQLSGPWPPYSFCPVLEQRIEDC
ncbi:MAG: GvpL/GvpF family gas vesicle protein [Desulfobacterales bacterium]|nr:GvpL/GvpF family gas vesicle protein [Desulfobacterales bacterium]